MVNKKKNGGIMVDKKVKINRWISLATTGVEYERKRLEAGLTSSPKRFLEAIELLGRVIAYEREE